MILAAAALLGQNSRPADEDVDRVFAEHVCRCGSYPRVRRAIRRAAETGGNR
jgi:isoquinoline 1-oxidoreductase alpha subunit